MTESENTMRIIATGVNYTSPDPEDPSQSSLSLDSSVMSAGFQNTGQDNITAPGQGLFLILPLKIGCELITPNPAPSQTSSNNWINYCKGAGKQLTNGQQVQGTSAVLLVASEHPD